MTERLQRLVGVASRDGDALGSLHTGEIGYDGQAELSCGLVGEYEQAVVLDLGNSVGQRLLQIFGNNNFLWFHCGAKVVQKREKYKRKAL